MFDIVIEGGTVITGDKSSRFQADVGIGGGRIQQIGNLREAEAGNRVDATGKVVAPGFVDVHNHSDAWLLKTPHLVSKTIQGFTTEVIMADGISYAPVDRHVAREWIYYLRALNALRFEEYQGWESLAEYMALLDRSNVQNSIPHVPYANVRSMVCGFGRAAPDDYQIGLIQKEVERGMEAGAVGLSTGMDYIVQCYASTDELVEACRPLAEVQGLYVTHMRYKRGGTLGGLKEAVEIGRRAGVPVHISHLKGTSPDEVAALIDYIDTVAVNEVDFSFDVYPYLPGSTMLNYWLPYEVWDDGPYGVIEKLRHPEIRTRFAQSMAGADLSRTHIAWVAGKENSKHQGHWLSDYVEELGLPIEDALIDLLVEENLAVLLVMHMGSEELIDPILAHEKYMMGSDGIYHEDGAIHPRQYGSAARLLGPAVRDRGLFTLEEAVYKLSGYPAERFGLRERGQLREGWHADVVVFDADTIVDKATFEEPHQLSMGVEHVLVNGAPIVVAGAPLDVTEVPLPGRALSFKQQTSE